MHMPKVNVSSQATASALPSNNTSAMDKSQGAAASQGGLFNSEATSHTPWRRLETATMLAQIPLESDADVASPALVSVGLGLSGQHAADCSVHSNVSPLMSRFNSRGPSHTASREGSGAASEADGHTASRAGSQPDPALYPWSAGAGMPSVGYHGQTLKTAGHSDAGETPASSEGQHLSPDQAIAAQPAHGMTQLQSLNACDSPQSAAPHEEDDGAIENEVVAGLQMPQGPEAPSADGSFHLEATSTTQLELPSAIEPEMAENSAQPTSRLGPLQGTLGLNDHLVEQKDSEISCTVFEDDEICSVENLRERGWGETTSGAVSEADVANYLRSSLEDGFQHRHRPVQPPAHAFQEADVKQPSQDIQRADMTRADSHDDCDGLSWPPTNEATVLSAATTEVHRATSAAQIPPEERPEAAARGSNKSEVIDWATHGPASEDRTPSKIPQHSLATSAAASDMLGTSDAGPLRSSLEEAPVSRTPAPHLTAIAPIVPSTSASERAFPAQRLSFASISLGDSSSQVISAPSLSAPSAEHMQRPTKHNEPIIVSAHPSNEPQPGGTDAESDQLGPRINSAAFATSRPPSGNTSRLLALHEASMPFPEDQAELLPGPDESEGAGSMPGLQFPQPMLHSPQNELSNAAANASKAPACRPSTLHPSQADTAGAVALSDAKGTEDSVPQRQPTPLTALGAAQNEVSLKSARNIPDRPGKLSVHQAVAVVHVVGEPNQAAQKQQTNAKWAACSRSTSQAPGMQDALPETLSPGTSADTPHAARVSQQPFGVHDAQLASGVLRPGTAAETPHAAGSRHQPPDESSDDNHFAPTTTLDCSPPDLEDLETTPTLQLSRDQEDPENRTSMPHGSWSNPNSASPLLLRQAHATRVLRPPDARSSHADANSSGPCPPLPGHGNSSQHSADAGSSIPEPSRTQSSSPGPPNEEAETQTGQAETLPVQRHSRASLMGHADFGPAAHAQQPSVAVCCNPLYASSARAASISPPSSPRHIRPQSLASSPIHSPNVLNCSQSSAQQSLWNHHPKPPSAATSTPSTHLHGDSHTLFSMLNSESLCGQPLHLFSSTLGHQEQVQKSAPALTAQQPTREGLRESKSPSGMSEVTPEHGLHPTRLFWSESRPGLGPSIQLNQGHASADALQSSTQQEPGHVHVPRWPRDSRSTAGASPDDPRRKYCEHAHQHDVRSPILKAAWPLQEGVYRQGVSIEKAFHSLPHKHAQSAVHANRRDQPLASSSNPLLLASPRVQKSHPAGMRHSIDRRDNAFPSCSVPMWSSFASSKHAELHAMADLVSSMQPQPSHLLPTMPSKARFPTHGPAASPDQQQPSHAAHRQGSAGRSVGTSAGDPRCGQDFEGVQTFIAAAGKSSSPEGRLKGAMQRMARIHARQAQVLPPPPPPGDPFPNRSSCHAFSQVVNRPSKFGNPVWLACCSHWLGNHRRSKASLQFSSWLTQGSG